MGARKRNGEGTISGPRKDGRYVGAFYAPTNTGTTKRVYVYGRTHAEAREKLIAEQAKVMAGIPVPAQSWKLGAYLDYWLEHVVNPPGAPLRSLCMRSTSALHLKPGLGKHQLMTAISADPSGVPQRQLKVRPVGRNVQILRQVLSAALSRAMREELVSAMLPA